MFTIDRTDPELDPAAVLAENDRIMAEAASDALAHARIRARQNPDGLVYRVHENARLCASAPTYEPVSNDNDDFAALNADSSGEFDSYTMGLLESLGDALGVTCIELRREWHAADVKLLDRISDLHNTSKNLECELRALTTSYEDAQTRIAELEHQVATLTATLGDKVNALSVAIAGEPSARDFDSRIAYMEALMSTMFPMPARSRV